MKSKWHKSQYPGVRFREHPERKYNNGKETKTIASDVSHAAEDNAGWASRKQRLIAPHSDSCFERGNPVKKTYRSDSQYHISAPLKPHTICRFYAIMTLSAPLNLPGNTLVDESCQHIYVWKSMSLVSHSWFSDTRSNDQTRLRKCQHRKPYGIHPAWTGKSLQSPPTIKRIETGLFRPRSEYPAIGHRRPGIQLSDR